FLRHFVRRPGPSPAPADPEDGAMRPARCPARPVREELDPLDEAGQHVAHLLERRAVGVLERLYSLLVGLLAFRSACPADEDPDRGLSRLDLRGVAVPELLAPLDRTR